MNIFIWIVNGVLLGLLIMLFLVFRKEIMSFFFPEKYLMVLMREKDGNIAKFIVERNETMTFNFQRGIYNLYDGYHKETGDQITSKTEEEVSTQSS